MDTRNVLLFVLVRFHPPAVFPQHKPDVLHDQAESCSYSVPVPLTTIFDSLCEVTLGFVSNYRTYKLQSPCFVPSPPNTAPRPMVTNVLEVKHFAW